MAAPLIACTLLIGACSSATSPTKLEPPPGAYRSVFTSLKGETGFGGISVTPKAIPEGTFTADISLRVTGLTANTTHLVQSAQEGAGGRPLGGDGICQRSLSVAADRPLPDEIVSEAFEILSMHVLPVTSRTGTSYSGCRPTEPSRPVPLGAPRACLPGVAPSVTCPHCQSEDTAPMTESAHPQDDSVTWFQCRDCRRVWAEHATDTAFDDDDSELE